MNRIERLAAILLLLQEKPRTSGQIAAHFEISRRTVLRDIQALSEMGVPVIAQEGPGGGYSLPGDYRSEPLPLTGNEAFLLLLALSGIERLPDLPFRQERVSLLAKLRALLPQSRLSSAQALLSSVAVDAPAQGKKAPFLEALLSAAQEERWVRVIYQSSERTSTQHLLPRQIYTQNGFWYCLAYAEEHQAERSYRADRIQSLEAPEAGFTPGPIRETLPYGHESHPRVVAHLTPRGAARVESDPNLGSQICRLADGQAELAFHCPPGELEYYARYFAGLGPEVDVLAPEDLRRMILALGEKLVERYSKQ